jgi:hypothetical protein
MKTQQAGALKQERVNIFEYSQSGKIKKKVGQQG